MFHVVFMLPSLMVVTWLAFKSAPSSEFMKKTIKKTGLLCVLAVVWTTPWDNYLIMSGVWSYPENHVLFVIGYVPIEEYTFFVLQTILVAMVWLWQGKVETIPHFKRDRSGYYIVGLCVFAIMMLVSLYLITTNLGLYLGLISLWCAPILAVEWFFGAYALMAQRDAWQRPLMISFIFLCLVDRWAIRNGCWTIAQSSTLPQFDWLPVEEAWFFLLTSTMVIWGLQLFMNFSTLECSNKEAFRRVCHWARKVQSTKSSPSHWSPGAVLFVVLLGVALAAAARLRVISLFA